MSQSGRLTFVLVHGAWHGGWCWRRVRERLEALGHRVHVPTLAGLAERAYLLDDRVDLMSHVREIAAAFIVEDLDDVILCGHSYGGMVIRGVADRLSSRIRSIVYLDAFVPEDGESVETICGGRLLPVDGDAVAPPPVDFFSVNPIDADWVASRLTPHPSASFAQPIRLEGGAQPRRRTYIQATVNTLAFLKEQRRRVEASGDYVVREIECGHDVMIDDPDALVAALIEAA